MSTRHSLRFNQSCRIINSVFIVSLLTDSLLLCSIGHAAQLRWASPNQYRMTLSVDPVRMDRSSSPAKVEIDFVKTLAELGGTGHFDEHTIEVMAYDTQGNPKVYDASRPGYEQYLLPWRIDKFYGINSATLNFIMPDHTYTQYVVYFDTIYPRIIKRT